MAIQRDFQQFQARGYKARVRFATTAVLPTYFRSANTIVASANGVFPTQDGVPPALNDDVLYWTGVGPLAPDNGIFTLTQLGSGGAPFILTRRSDFNASEQIPAVAQVSVAEGLLYKGAIFNLQTPEPIVLDTTDLVFDLAASGGGGGGGGGIFETVANGDTATVPENQILPVFNKLSVEDGKVTGGGKIDLVDTDRNYTQFDIPRRSRYRIPAGQQMLYKGIPRIDGILVADGLLTDSSPSGGELLSTLGDVLGPGEMIVGGNSPAVPSDQAAVRANLNVPTSAEVTAEISSAIGVSVGPLGKLLPVAVSTPGFFSAEVGKLYLISGAGVSPQLPPIASTSVGDTVGIWGMEDVLGTTAGAIYSHDLIALEIAGIEGSGPAGAASYPLVRTAVYFVSDGSLWRAVGDPYMQLAAGGTNRLLGNDSAGAPASFDQAAFRLNPTPDPLKTGSYAALAGDLVRWDGSSNLTLNLPASPANGDRVGFIEAGSATFPGFTLTLVPGGTALLDSAFEINESSKSFRGRRLSMVWVYDEDGDRWRPESESFWDAKGITTDCAFAFGTSGQMVNMTLPDNGSVFGKINGSPQGIPPYILEANLRLYGTKIATSLTSDVNNYTPGGSTSTWRRAWWVVITPNTAGHQITGFTSWVGSDDFNTSKTLFNNSTTDSFFIQHQSTATGTTQYRVICPGGVAYEVKPQTSVRLAFDETTNSRWIVEEPPSANHFRSTNSAGFGLTQGEPVQTSGTASFTQAVDTSGSFWGIVDEPLIPDVTEGRIAHSGTVRVPAARQTGTWSTGEDIYVDATAGKLTNIATTTVGRFVIPVGLTLTTPGGGDAELLLRAGPIVEIT